MICSTKCWNYPQCNKKDDSQMTVFFFKGFPSVATVASYILVSNASGGS